MKNKTIIRLLNEETVIQRFNKREEAAFEDIYGLLYPDLFYFIRKYYSRTSLEPEDVLQDIFLKLWTNRQPIFTSIDHLKGYIYTSIRNYFRDYYSHRQVQAKYSRMVKEDDDFFISKIIETEIIAELSRIPNIFPAECAKVLKLYLEGWDIKDIAEKLDKAPNTIYTQRQEIIAILKKIMSRKLLLLLLISPIANRSKC